MVILAHAIIKEDSQVPDRDIELALTAKELFVLNPEIHIYNKQEGEANE